MTPGKAGLAQLVECIVECVHPLRIVLFGSAARGEMGRGSDINLMVVMPDGTNRRRTAQRLYQSIRGVSQPFDLVVATPEDLERHRDTPGLIYREILRDGVTIYGGGA